jgi:hypothetical protein
MVPPTMDQRRTPTRLPVAAHNSDRLVISIFPKSEPLLLPNALVQLQAHLTIARGALQKSACLLQRSLGVCARGLESWILGGSRAKVKN